MLHGIINEKGHCLDVRDDNSGKINNFYFLHVSYKSLTCKSISCLYLRNDIHC